MGAVLLQEGHPISYLSKNFCPNLQSSATYICDYMQLLLLFKGGGIICLGENLP